MFRARLLSLWETVSSSYWFVPSLMSTAAFVLSVAMTYLDETLPGEWLEHVPWLYTGTADGARSLLATIASSMIGVAGVVFSITIVSLTLASNQFGPRLLRNFMRDKGNQITLGTFLAAFLYCLLVLRKVQGGEAQGGVFVPQLSLLVALLLALAGVGVLIFFIHHAAASIQAPNVIAAVASELMQTIDLLFPETIGDAAEPPHDSPPLDAAADLADSTAIFAGRGGYVLRIEDDQLMSLAREHDLLVRVEHRPGQFVQPDDLVLRVWPKQHAEDAVLQAFKQSFVVGNRRSLAQDAEFAVEQLVEVASRALSPGINDPFTAMQCVDRLGEALSALALRKFPAPYRSDEEGRLRVIAYPKSFGDFLDVSYNQIRQYAADSPDVLLRMLEAMQRVALRVRRPDDIRDLAEHAAMVGARAFAAVEKVGGSRDRRKVEQRAAELERLLADRG